MENIKDLDNVVEQQAIQNAEQTYTHKIFRTSRKPITLTQANMQLRKKTKEIAAQKQQAKA